jgi:hypothetical protein
MFKKFLMENAHRENVKHLFRWWNGHVFSFETVPGTNRKDDDGFDSGMEAAEAALNSDEEFSDRELGGPSGENFGDDGTGRHHQADQPVRQMNTDSRPDGLLSINSVQLTIPERSASEAPGPSDSDHSVVAPVHATVNSADDPHDSLTQANAGIRDLLQVINTTCQFFYSHLYSCQSLLVDELRNWIQEHEINPSKSRKKEGEIITSAHKRLIFSSCVLDLITVILNAPMTEQPTPADIGALASHLKLKRYKYSFKFIHRKRLGKGKSQQGWCRCRPPENGPLRFLNFPTSTVFLAFSFEARHSHSLLLHVSYVLSSIFFRLSHSFVSFLPKRTIAVIFTESLGYIQRTVIIYSILSIYLVTLQ